MFGKLDLQSRRLLAHYRALPGGSALHIMQRSMTKTGKTMVVLSAYFDRAAA